MSDHDIFQWVFIAFILKAELQHMGWLDIHKHRGEN